MHLFIVFALYTDDIYFFDEFLILAFILAAPSLFITNGAVTKAIYLCHIGG